VLQSVGGVKKGVSKGVGLPTAREGRDSEVVSSQQIGKFQSILILQSGRKIKYWRLTRDKTP
jgi:hypothetical protein